MTGGNPVPDIASQHDLMQYADRLKNGTVWVMKLRPAVWEHYALVPRDEADKYIEWEAANVGGEYRVLDYKEKEE